MRHAINLLPMDARTAAALRDLDELTDWFGHMLTLYMPDDGTAPQLQLTDANGCMPICYEALPKGDGWTFDKLGGAPLVDAHEADRPLRILLASAYSGALADLAGEHGEAGMSGDEVRAAFIRSVGGRSAVAHLLRTDASALRQAFVQHLDDLHRGHKITSRVADTVVFGD